MVLTCMLTLSGDNLVVYFEEQNGVIFINTQLKWAKQMH